MLTSPVYEVPCWTEGNRHWVSGYLELRGSRAVRSLISWSPAQNGLVIGTPSIGVGGKSIPAMLLRDGSLDYRGDLMVLCVPKGGAFTIQLSDIPYVAPPPPAFPLWWQQPASTARRAGAILEAARSPA